jgi:hypothetical protein
MREQMSGTTQLLLWQITLKLKVSGRWGKACSLINATFHNLDQNISVFHYCLNWIISAVKHKWLLISINTSVCLRHLKKESTSTIFYFIFIYLFINCNWFVTRWPYTFTHTHTHTHTLHRTTQITTKQHK